MARRVSRWLRAPATAPLLIVALVVALPGRALFDSILLDSYAIRLKGHVLSLGALFRPDQTDLANPYYRPLFAVLHELVDRCTGDSDLGQRLLALGAHAFAAFALLAFARALGLGRRARTLALVLFLVAPGNVATAAWPLVAYWVLAAALTWVAAARLVVFVRDGRRGALATSLLLAAVSLFCGESAYFLAAFAPLLAFVSARGAVVGMRVAPAEAAARRRALLAWPLFAVIAVLHYAFLEVHAQSIAGAAPREKIVRTLAAWPRFVEAAAGGSAWDGSRPLAWGVLAVAGVAALLRPRLRRLALLAPLAAFPFLALGHNERYGYFAVGVTALLLARALPTAFLRAGVPARVAQLAPLALAAVVATQVPARLASVRAAAAVTRTLVTDLDAHRALLDDLDHVVFVNTPMPLRWAIADRLAPRTREQFESILARVQMRTWLCTADAYFGMGPADLRPAGAQHALVFDGGHLVERPPDRPLGERRLLPLAFLARGLEVLPSTPEDADGKEREARRDAVLARFDKLADPLATALVEEPLPRLQGELPDRQLSIKLEPLSASSAAAPSTPFAQRLVATVDVPRPALLVVVTFFEAEDPIHRMTGDVGRFCDLFEAQVDGAPERVVPVFFHAIGVVVPAGSHVVRISAKAVHALAAAPAGG